MQKSKNAGQTHVTLGLKLILNPAARGRERAASAPFNASVVRDHEKWIHHHLFLAGFGCPLGPPAWSIGSDSVRALSVSLMVTKGGKTMQNVYSNLYSQAVTHPSTNRSQPCLTSVIGRELVYSR